MEITKHFFYNLSMLIILLFIGLILFDKTRRVNIPKYSIVIMFVIATWASIQFAYQPVEPFRYDLRIIPIVIGGLYLGIGPLLSVFVLVFRSFYGLDLGFYESCLMYIPLAFILWRFYPWFWKQGSQRRIFSAVSMGFFLGLFTTAAMELSNVEHIWYDAWFAYMVIPPLGIGIISYSIEFVKNSIDMRHHLVKTEKLQAVEQMGAAISHEIRNPLTAAIGFVQLLQDSYLPKHKHDEYLSIVKQELHAAEKVIEDYLTFAKPALMDFKEFNVKKELQQVINTLQPMANQYSVHISSDFSVIGFIKGDPQKFRQCILNVMKNAIESMPHGGYLAVEMENRQTHIIIRIRDTGVGMTNEQIQRLGEPYYSTKGAKGTGLGMMVVYGIARAMDGTIRVESEVGKGTSFQFKFPSYRALKS